MISRNGIHIESCNAQTIVDWATPNSIHDI